MVSISDIIKGHVEAITSPSEFTFFEGEKAYANLQADKKALPVAWLGHPLVPKMRPKKIGGAELSWPIEILFAKKSQLDYTPAQHQDIENEMLVVALAFIDTLQKDDDIREVTLTDNSRPVRRVSDACLTGFYLNVIVCPHDTISIC